MCSLLLGCCHPCIWSLLSGGHVCVYSAATTMAMPEDSHVPHSHLAYHVRRIGEGGAPLHPVGRLDK